MTKRYNVVVEGRNFSVNYDGNVLTMGFFTTFRMEVGTVYELKKKLRVLLLQRIKSHSTAFLNSDKKNPYFFVSSIFTVHEHDAGAIQGGFAFYTMSGIDVFNANLKYYFAQILCNLKIRKYIYEPENVRGLIE